MGRSLVRGALHAALLDLIIVGIVAIVRWFLSRFDSGSPAALEDPLEVLKRRYAMGEIDKAEFEEKRKDILGS